MMLGTIFLIIASILWGAVHSILASHAAKDLIRRLSGSLAFDRMYRFSYNLFSLASFFPIAAMLLTFPDKPLYSIAAIGKRSEEHTSELQSPDHLVCPLLLAKKKHTPLRITLPPYNSTTP